MSDAYEVETIRRVYANTEGAYVEVGLDGEGGDWIEIRTAAGKSADYFGLIRLTMPPAFASLLAEALHLAVADATKKRTEP